MLKRIKKFCESVPMTTISGLFVAVSFFLPEAAELAWGAIFISGFPLLHSAGARLLCAEGIKKISSPLLVSIAMIAAISIGDLFAAAEVAFIMALGELLEDLTVRRAGKGLKRLTELTPPTGRLLCGTKERTVPVDEIKKDDMLRILPGETIPADGIIVRGETTVDQSALTGESLPVEKTVGERVFSGSVNRFGSIDIKAAQTGRDSSLQKLIAMIANTEKNNSETQRLADKWASLLVPVSLFVAVLTYLATDDIVRAVTVLIVFCPCALVLATPTAIMAAVGQAAKNGVIIKSGLALEKTGNVKTFAFDKTGTLTSGRLQVCDILPFSTDEEALLRIAASVERFSEHPIGKAITEEAAERRIAPYEAKSFKMTAGQGVEAEIDGKTFFLGTERHTAGRNVRTDEKTAAALSSFKSAGKAVVIVSDSEKIAGIIALSDTIRPEAREVVSALSRAGVASVLLTGDNYASAQYFAKKAGIDTVYADLLPADKLRLVKELQKNGILCMTGDGINDAPALKAADVGISLNKIGSDIAVDAADIVLMNDDLSRMPYLKWLSNKTLQTIRTAITLSMLINAAAVALSAAGMLTPVSGALVHNAGSFFVVLSAALLYDKKYPEK